MGQVVIELPQNVNRFYRIESVELGEEILQELDDKQIKMKTPEKVPAIIPPRRNSLKEDGDAVLGIWSDREESADEITRRIRDRNNGKI